MNLEWNINSKEILKINHEYHSHNNHCDHRNKIRLINKNQINRVIKQRPFKVE